MKRSFAAILSLIVIGLAITAAPVSAQATITAAPDTLVVFNAAVEEPGALPGGWEQVLPEDQFAYTTYNIERSIDGNYLRARSTGSGSWIEIGMDSIDPAEYPILAWQWKVDQFPETGWENDPAQDDFALRIELVYDFTGTWKNPLNIIRKGLITSVFKGYPPERTISYVWSVNVPTLESYTSPESKRLTVVPIESTNVLVSRWMRERVNILDTLTELEPSKDLVLKKIRIRADTDNSGGMSDGGIKYVYLVRGN